MPLGMPDDIIPLPHESLHSHSSKAAGLPRVTAQERQRQRDRERAWINACEQDGTHCFSVTQTQEKHSVTFAVFYLLELCH